MTTPENSDQRLSQVREALKAPESFAATVAQAIEVLGITDDELAEKFDMSRPSVARWRAGSASPHPALQPHVLTFLRQRAEELWDRRVP